MALVLPQRVANVEVDNNQPAHSNDLRHPKTTLRRELYQSVLQKFQGSADDAVFITSNPNTKQCSYLRAGISHGLRDGTIRLTRIGGSLNHSERRMLAQLARVEPTELKPLPGIVDRIHLTPKGSSSIINGRYGVDNARGVISYARLKELAAKLV